MVILGNSPKARFIKKKAKRKVEKEGEIVYDRHTK